MAFDFDIVRKQVIALMNLSVRDSAGVPTYSTSLGDTSYSADEITRACQSAVTVIMRAICETDGHPDRRYFTTSMTITHAAQLPAHYGSIGVPQITPFTSATYTIAGKLKSIQEIYAYRDNPGNMYSAVNHNAANGSTHSRLAGFYCVDNNAVHFTGKSAVADLANFQESDYVLLPDTRYPLAIALAIANLKKDGDVSDIFDYYLKQGMSEVVWMKQNKLTQPSLNKTIGTRESGQV